MATGANDCAGRGRLLDPSASLEYTLEHIIDSEEAKEVASGREEDCQHAEKRPRRAVPGHLSALSGEDLRHAVEQHLARLEASLRAARARLGEAAARREVCVGEQRQLQRAAQEAAASTASSDRDIVASDARARESEEGLRWLEDAIRQIERARTKGVLKGQVLESFTEVLAPLNRTEKLQGLVVQEAMAAARDVRDRRDLRRKDTEALEHKVSRSKEGVSALDEEVRAAQHHFDQLSAQKQQQAGALATLCHQFDAAASVAAQATAELREAATRRDTAQARCTECVASSEDLQAFLAGRGSRDAAGLRRRLQAVMPAREPATLMLIALLDSGVVDPANTAVAAITPVVFEQLRSTTSHVQEQLKARQQELADVEHRAAQASKAFGQRQQQLAVALGGVANLVPQASTAAAVGAAAVRPVAGPLRSSGQQWQRAPVHGGAAAPTAPKVAAAGTEQAARRLSGTSAGSSRLSTASTISR
mmetsp:Transcript_49418/g.159472  ORF Transcript_49418/g.159472 Transcript_49418/m.159472 type:complete len:478 (+) Transcript_49418:131-1564(+)